MRISLLNPASVQFVTEDIFELLGYKANQFMDGSVSFQSLIHTDDQDIADILFSKQSSEPQSGNFNIRLRQANQRILCVKGSYIKRLGVVDLELNDAKRLWRQDGDQNMMENFKAMMDNTDDFIFFKDRNHVFTGASQSLTAVTESVKHWTEFLGVTDYDVFPEEYADIYYSLEKKIFSGANVAHEIQKFVKQDGTTGWVSNRKYAIRNSTEEIVGLFGIARDVTADKQSQIALAQAEKMVSLGMLVAGVAHEINNPLTYSILNLEKAKDLLQTSKAEDYLGSVQKQISLALDGVKRITNIVKSLSTLSRVKNTKTEVINFISPLETAINMAMNEIKYRARIIKDFKEPLMVNVNSGELTQVFLNLLINAAHAINEGDEQGNHITIKTWKDVEWAYVSITDTGSGISAKNLDKIFTPFFTTKDVGKGTGLGLSISYNIIQNFGGQLLVQSEEGVGTTFTVQLPVAESPRTSTHSVSLEKERTLVRGRILIIDDEVEIRNIISECLNHCEVIEADSGLSAQQRLQTDRNFDAIICDIMMPKMSGMDLYVWILKEAPELASKFVFITGGAFTDSVRNFLLSIGDRKLEKPFTRDTLLKSVEKTMSLDLI